MMKILNGWVQGSRQGLRLSIGRRGAKLPIVLAIMSLLMVTEAQEASPVAAAPAHFQMPFPCGETWIATTYAGHPPANAIDLNKAGGDGGLPVVASAAGVAYNKSDPAGYGNYVDVVHDGGWVTRYAHLSAFGVANGASVSQGTRIGSVGSTGNSTGDHLHYEQRLNNVAQHVTFNGQAIAYTSTWGAAQYTSQNCGAASIPNGAFVVTPSGHVYRIAGGAPIYVSTWSIYGGTQPVVPVTDLSQFRSYPADGTYIASVQDGKVYRVAGGAPLYVSAGDASQLPGWGGQIISIDKWSIDNAGHSLSHLRPYPADGTFLANVADGRVYKVAGGAPLYVSAADASQVPGYNSGANVVVVSSWEFSNHTHLRRFPADGTFLANVANGRVYKVAGGAPLYVSAADASQVPGYNSGANVVVVSSWEFNNYSRLRRNPADGTFLRNVGTNEVSKVVGGAPVLVSAANADLVPGYNSGSSTIGVSAWEFTNFGNLRPMPATGSLLKGVPSGEVWRVNEGCRYEVAVSATASQTVDDYGVQVMVPMCQVPTVIPGAGSWTETDEGPGELEVPVSLSNPAPYPVTINYATLDNGDSGVATAGVDYTAASGTVTFAPGETLKMVTLAGMGDTIDEPPLLYGEWILVAFSNPSEGAALDTSFFGLGIGVILDNDPTPTIAPGTGSVIEGDTGTTVLNVEVTLSNPSAQAISLDYSTLDTGDAGVATAGSDYVAASGTVTFAPGETSKMVTLTVMGDTLLEPPLVYGEWILVAFSNPSAGATLDTSFFGLGIGVIIDDD